MSKVYYFPYQPNMGITDIQSLSKALLRRVCEENQLQLAPRLPIKVHFGEKGNETYIRSENYQGIIEYLQERGCQCYYTETSVLYAGERYERDRHLKLALEHGFTQLPIVMADGQEGEDFVEVPIGKKHFKSCYLGRGIVESEQLIVLSHFKGHILAGFGGALKQLSMGCAARAGKLAMHRGVKPQIKNSRCHRCHVCERRCNFGAITIGDKCHIDHAKCQGCGACYAACPHGAIKSFSFYSLDSIINILFGGRAFREGLMEYAYASQKGKRNIYINFAFNITKGCDCETRRMKPVVPNLGVYASLDPVAVDMACYDAVLKAGYKLAGIHMLEYAEHLGIGTRTYELSNVT